MCPDAAPPAVEEKGFMEPLASPSPQGPWNGTMGPTTMARGRIGSFFGGMGGGATRDGVREPWGRSERGRVRMAEGVRSCEISKPVQFVVFLRSLLRVPEVSEMANRPHL